MGNKIIGAIKEFDNELLNEILSESLTNENRIISKQEIISFEESVIFKIRFFIEPKLFTKHYFRKINEISKGDNELQIRYALSKYLLPKVKELRSETESEMGD